MPKRTILTLFGTGAFAATPRLLMLAIVGTLALGACVSPGAETPDSTSPPPVVASAPVALDPVVLDDPSRPTTERDQDAGRKPLEVYEFFGVRPGASVADVYSADGYNTHLLSRLVGEGGRVYSVHHTVDGFPRRFETDRYVLKFRKAGG